MIYFKDIYKKAVNLFDDPKITYAYENNRILFEKYMYGYLQTVSIYEPVRISQCLANINEPNGQIEFFDADGTSKTFNYEIEIPFNSSIVFRENDKIVEAIIDAENHTITFPEILDAGNTYSVEYYDAGSYEADFSSITGVAETYKDITLKVTNILARLIVIAWAEETRNMLVDIQGLLRDSDFKATPNSQILQSKTAWVKQLLYENKADQTKLAWYIRYSSGVAKFKRR